MKESTVLGLSPKTGLIEASQLAGDKPGGKRVNDAYRCPNGGRSRFGVLLDGDFVGDFVPAPERAPARVCSRYPAEIAELAAGLPDAALAPDHYFRLHGFSVERGSGTLTATSATDESLTATFDDEGRSRERKAKR